MKRFQNVFKGQNNGTLYTHTHLISEKQNQTGRSMVEMLGVLAVIGVLSVAGIAGFKNAMDKNKANTIINEAQKRATLVVPQIQLMGNENPTIAEFINNDLGYGEFDTKVYTKADGLPEGQFGIKVSGVNKSICQNILNTIGDNTVIRRLSTPDAPTTPITTCGETNTFLMVYNNDMTSNAVAGEFGYDDCPESFHQCDTTHSCVATENDCPAICELDQALSMGCVCPEHRDRTGGICGDCVDVETYVTWEQSEHYLSSNGTMGVDDFACTSSSILNYNHPAFKAFDGKVNYDGSYRFWHAAINDIPNWLAWYTSTPIKINAITITNRPFENDPISDRAVPKNFEIQYSDDFSNWTVVYTGINPHGPLLSTNFPVNSTSAHKYWRIYTTTNHVDASISPHVQEYSYTSIGELIVNADELNSITDYELNASGYCEVVE